MKDTKILNIAIGICVTAMCMALFSYAVLGMAAGCGEEIHFELGVSYVEKCE